MTSWLPASNMSCANIAARMPEPHILDKVTAPALSGSPPLKSLPRSLSAASSGYDAGQ